MHYASKTYQKLVHYFRKYYASKVCVAMANRGVPCVLAKEAQDGPGFLRRRSSAFGRNAIFKEDVNELASQTAKQTLLKEPDVVVRLVLSRQLSEQMELIKEEEGGDRLRRLDRQAL